MTYTTINVIIIDFDKLPHIYILFDYLSINIDYKYFFNLDEIVHIFNHSNTEA